MNALEQKILEYGFSAIKDISVKFGNFLNDYQPHPDGSWRDKNDEDYTTDELFNLFIEETYGK